MLENCRELAEFGKIMYIEISSTSKPAETSNMESANEALLSTECDNYWQPKTGNVAFYLELDWCLLLWAIFDITLGGMLVLKSPVSEVKK